MVGCFCPWSPQGFCVTFDRGWGYSNGSSLYLIRERKYKLATSAQAPQAPRPQVFKFKRTDAGNAELFAFHNRNSLRYDHAKGQWMINQGFYWKAEDKGQTTKLAIEAVRIRGMLGVEFSELEEEKEWALKSESANGIKAVLHLARALPPISSAGEQWDGDPWLLGTPQGIYDLRTGQKVESTESYITKLTSVGPASQATCPLWQDFINKITRNDLTFSSYLQRFCGYTLTGLTREHSMQFLYGLGSNGKSTYEDTLYEILKDYAHVLPIRVITASKYEQHPTELADLTGKRLVISSETEPGRHWKESLLKGMVSGDPMNARKMRMDSFTFTPTYKLIIAGNDMPYLTDVKEADRRRYQVVPFSTRFKDISDSDYAADTDAPKDKEFAAKLRNEYPAILRWMMDGCLQWQQEGINPPSMVIMATEGYLSGQDRETLWMVEHCVKDATAKTRTSDLFDSWLSWCEVNHEPDAGTRREFTQRLIRRGHLPCKVGEQGQAGVRGLRLRRSEDTPVDENGHTENKRVN